jgi:vacuolar-type H+-ATPase subunit C/Vma6
MSAAGLAYGHARVRARKSRLWTRDDALARLARPDRAYEPPGELYAALAFDYAIALQGYPDARPLLMALWRRHEIENLKLAWRARSLSLPAAGWRPYWRALGSLAAVAAEDVERSTSLAALAGRLRATPYGAIAGAALRAHDGDPVAAELTFERWTYTAIVRELSALPARERATAMLVGRVVRERDLDRVRRAVPAYGLSPALAASLTVQLVHEMRPDAIERLAAWRPADGPLGRRLPRGLVPAGAGVADWDALTIRLRSERRRACMRAFMGPPFVIAPAVAYLLLREAEIEGRLAIASGYATHAPAALERAVAASLMGA